MSATLLSPNDCCRPDCDEPVIENIPGPQGEPGVDGADGADGSNAFTTLTAGFTQPASGSNVTATVASSVWMIVGQNLFVGTAGEMEVISKPDTTHVVLKNLGYSGNAAPTTAIPNGAAVSPSGKKGVDGTSAAGDMLQAMNLSDVDSVPTSRSNLGLGTAALQDVGAFAQVANNLSDVTAATARTNLGLVIGTNVQAFDAMLAALAGLVTVNDRLLYFTGADAPALATFTAYARTMLDDATALASRATLGSVLPRYGCLGSLTAVDLNSATTDNAITMESARYRIDKVIVENASVSLTLATAGLFTAAGGGGTTLAADQVLSALTASSKFDDLTLQAITGTDVFTSGTLYFRVGSAQGAPATANVWIMGEKFD